MRNSFSEQCLSVPDLICDGDEEVTLKQGTEYFIPAGNSVTDQKAGNFSLVQRHDVTVVFTHACFYTTLLVHGDVYLTTVIFTIRSLNP